jgi:hypothetical protein
MRRMNCANCARSIVLSWRDPSEVPEDEGLPGESPLIDPLCRKVPHICMHCLRDKSDPQRLIKYSRSRANSPSALELNAGWLLFGDEPRRSSGGRDEAGSKPDRRVCEATFAVISGAYFEFPSYLGRERAMGCMIMCRVRVCACVCVQLFWARHRFGGTAAALTRLPSLHYLSVPVTVTSASRCPHVLFFCVPFGL